jgi:hypothetical protein
LPVPIGCVFPQPGDRIMADKTLANSVHELVAKTFSELGANGPVIHTILLKDCRFGGDKFRCEGLQAIWAADSDIIEFYSEEEKMKLLKTVVIPAEEAAA